jgi:ABC-type glutathione transport system ATPase component
MILRGMIKKRLRGKGRVKYFDDNRPNLRQSKDCRLQISRPSPHGGELDAGERRRHTAARYQHLSPAFFQFQEAVGKLDAVFGSLKEANLVENWE